MTSTETNKKQRFNLQDLKTWLEPELKKTIKSIKPTSKGRGSDAGLVEFEDSSTIFVKLGMILPPAWTDLHHFGRREHVSLLDGIVAKGIIPEILCRKFDEKTEEVWLAMKTLSGFPLHSVDLTHEQIESIFSTLLRIHHESDLETAMSKGLTDVTIKLFANAEQMQKNFDIASKAGITPPKNWDSVRFTKMFPKIIAELEKAPKVYLHGDVHHDNISFESNGKTIFIDWQLSGRGPAMIDLAYWSANIFYAPTRAKIYDVYVPRYAACTGRSVNDCKKEYAFATALCLAWISTMFPAIENETPGSDFHYIITNLAKSYFDMFERVDVLQYFKSE